MSKFCCSKLVICLICVLVLTVLLSLCWSCNLLPGPSLCIARVSCIVLFWCVRFWSHLSWDHFLCLFFVQTFVVCVSFGFLNECIPIHQKIKQRWTTLVNPMEKEKEKDNETSQKYIINLLICSCYIHPLPSNLYTISLVIQYFSQLYS